MKLTLKNVHEMLIQRAKKHKDSQNSDVAEIPAAVTHLIQTPHLRVPFLSCACQNELKKSLHQLNESSYEGIPLHENDDIDFLPALEQLPLFDDLPFAPPKIMELYFH